jgi:hypothetical protein
MNCEWRTLTAGSQCIRCGVTLRRDYDAPPRCHCTPPATPGLGDHVEALLKSIGITQDRYTEVKAKFGLPATCGCSGRIEALNEWGAKVSAWWRGLYASH